MFTAMRRRKLLVTLCNSSFNLSGPWIFFQSTHNSTCIYTDFILSISLNGHLKITWKSGTRSTARGRTVRWIFHTLIQLPQLACQLNPPATAIAKLRELSRNAAALLLSLAAHLTVSPCHGVLWCPQKYVTRVEQRVTLISQVPYMMHTEH